MTQKSRSFVIDIDWDAKDGGYSVLRSKRVAKFLFSSLEKGKNLIQTCRPFTTHKTKLYLKAKSFKQWSQTPEWSEVGCKRDTSWLQSTPCRVGSNNKMFIKFRSNDYAAGFGIYLLMVLSGQVTETMHLDFVRVMQKTMTSVIIHNEEVDWFHMKQFNPTVLQTS